MRQNCQSYINDSVELNKLLRKKLISVYGKLDQVAHLKGSLSQNTAKML